MTGFAIVGGGWRAEFFLRVARALPDTLYAEAMVVRDPAKGKALEEEWGVQTFRTVDELKTPPKSPNLDLFE